MRKLRGVQGFDAGNVKELTDAINYWVDKTERESRDKGWTFNMIDVKFLTGQQDQKQQGPESRLYAVSIYDIEYPD